MWHKENLESALQSNFLKSTITTKIISEEVFIDSRKKTKNGLFVAIIGENNDGHDFLKQAFENGATMAIVQKIPADFAHDSRLILVKDSTKSLVNLATHARKNFAGKIIAITGSVGKTSIKEMLRTVLSQKTDPKIVSHKNKVFANYGNLNNHIGLPLSLCNLPQDCDYGVFEMGMNNPGEIEFLTKIALPDIAIISNIAKAHIGNFKNEDGIALAKSEIFLGVAPSGYAILNKDNKYFDFLKSQALKNNIKEENILSFGKNKESDICLESFENTDIALSKVHVKIAKKTLNYEINSINESTILNSLIGIAVLKILKVDFANYLPNFKTLETPAGRGNIIKINKNNKSFIIIDDSYNANLESMISGLKFLAKLGEQNPKGRTVAIIGDMLELGTRGIEEHKSIAKYINQFNIDKTLLVGDLSKNIIGELKKEQIIGHFDNSANLAVQIMGLVHDNDIILVKGSNGTKMNLIINSLKE